MSMTYNKPLTERLLSLPYKGLKDLLTVDLFSVYLPWRVDIVTRYIEVDFTFGLPDYVRYIEEFVILRFVISRFYSIHFTVTLAGTYRMLFVISRTSLNRGSLNRGSTVPRTNPPEWQGEGFELRDIGFTLFQTKMNDFPCPISDLIKKLLPYMYFRPNLTQKNASEIYNKNGKNC